MLSIMFIFVRCLRSSAAVTPVKYQHDIIQVTSVLIILNNWQNNRMEKIDLVTPTPDLKMIKRTVIFLYMVSARFPDICLEVIT